MASTSASGAPTIVDEKKSLEESRKDSTESTKASLKKADSGEVRASNPTGDLSEKIAVVGADGPEEGDPDAPKAEQEIEMLYPSAPALALLSIGLALVIFAVSCFLFFFF